MRKLFSYHLKAPCMRNLFYLPLFLLSGTGSPFVPVFIDPTGTYILKGEVKNSKIISHYGELRVRLLDTSRVALCLYINEGYPGYASAALTDTLHYEDNRAIYTPRGDSCSIYFVFDIRTVEIRELLTDPHSGCGFHPGVLIPAVFDKTSSDVPVIQDLSERGGI